MTKVDLISIVEHYVQKKQDRDSVLSAVWDYSEAQIAQNPGSTQLSPPDDFLTSDDLFAVDDDVYICTGIVHDDEKIYGRAISTFETSPKEKSFGFAQVTMKWRRQLS